MDAKRGKTMFVRAMYVMVIVAVAFSMMGSAFAQDEPPQFGLNIRAYIDGYSQLVIQGNNVYWHHIGAAAPGRHLFGNEPTYLNGTAWVPTWPDIPDAENKECNCDSSTFGDLNPALPENQGFVLNIIDARYSAFISQQPNADNNYTLIVDFDDWPSDGPAWYEVELAIDTNIPNPWLIAFPENDAVDGWEWPAGATVTLTINGTTDPDWSGIANVTTWGDPRTFLRIEFGIDYNLQTGDVVELTDGVTTITHTVQNLSVVDVNQDIDTLAGTADAGSVLHVWPHGHDQEATVQATAGGDGMWHALFTDLFDLIIGTCGRSQITDASGNATAVDWCAPKPWFAVFPEWDIYVQAFNYPFDATVHLAIDDPATEINPDYEADQITEVMPWSQNDAWAVFSLPPDYDMKPGDIVTLTSAGITPRGHTVQNLSIDMVDVEYDILAGMADTGAVVQVWPWGYEQDYTVEVTAEGGRWQVDYAALGFDLVEGSHGRAQISVNGNVTAMDWEVPPPPPVPFIWADPLCECINGWDWSDGDNITIQVFDQGGGELELQNPTQVYSAESGVFFDLGGEGIDLQAGYRITMSNGMITKELVVSQLVVKEMNPVDNTISGIYDPALDLVIQIGGQEPLSLELDGDQWVATFESVPLDGSGEVYQPDEDGDKTGLGWDGVPDFTRYDIYAFDVQSNGNERITTLDGTGEYDPSWSPNGRKVAHDVVYWDGSQSIYVTDVRTGISQPLKGAGDGGNDAAWSPNGLWIAFDRRWAGDQSIYIVPFTGGQRRLVRENAVSASWSPNGLRIVYQDLADGGKVKTVGLLGNLVIKVADFGENPAWSPDGKWIAYSRDGDIWKVRVGPLGTPYGDPILVADMDAWIGLPAWSDDSRIIVFDAGMTDDWDLWSVLAAGSEPIWLTGMPEYSEYGPDYWRNFIAYAGYTP